MPRGSAFYGQGTNANILTGRACIGTEARLIDCPFPDPNTICTHADDVGVDCNTACKCEKTHTEQFLMAKAS